MSVDVSEHSFLPLSLDAELSNQRSPDELQLYDVVSSTESGWSCMLGRLCVGQ